MVASISSQKPVHSVVFELPLPDRLPNGVEPEARVVVSELSWERYLEFDKPEARRVFRSGLSS